MTKGGREQGYGVLGQRLGFQYVKGWAEKAYGKVVSDKRPEEGEGAVRRGLKVDAFPH